MFWKVLFVLSISTIALAKQITDVELQWVICESSEEIFFSKLGVSQGKSLDRDVYYSDTDDLAVYTHGGTLRTRKSIHKMKTAAKIKGIPQSQIPWSLLKDKDFSCELDSYSGQETIGCKLNFEPKDGKKLYSRDQEDFLRHQIQFDQFEMLRTLGPAFSREWKWNDAELNQTIAVESMRARSKFFSLELSVRVPIEKKLKIASQVSKWLEKKSIHLCQQQEGKTEKLLRVLLQNDLQMVNL
jgi:hypothetical protein